MHDDLAPQSGETQKELNLTFKLSDTELELKELKKENEELAERLRLILNEAHNALSLGRGLLSKLANDSLLRITEIADPTLNKLEDLYDEPKEEGDPRITISCDASITKNPGGDASVGFVIRWPDETKFPTRSIGRRCKAKTNNEAEYDAIYEGLVTLLQVNNSPAHEVLILSDSKLAVSQLTGQWQIKEVKLKEKYTNIHTLAAAAPCPIRIEWRPRNSTEDLEQANFLAQDALGVKRH